MKAMRAVVQPMERGQITIPAKIREKLNIDSDSWLWVRLVEGKILIEPIQVDDSPSSLSDFLVSDVSDSQSYWTDEDDKLLDKVAKKSEKRLKKLAK